MAGIITPVSSALGIDNKRILTNVDDLNEIGDGRYCFINADCPKNSVGYNATVFQFTTIGRPDDKYQFIFDYNNSSLQVRMLRGDTWS